MTPCNPWLDECGPLRLDREGIVWLDTGDDLHRIGPIDHADAPEGSRADLAFLRLAWGDFTACDLRAETRADYYRAKGAL